MKKSIVLGTAAFCFALAACGGEAAPKPEATEDAADAGEAEAPEPTETEAPEAQETAAPAGITSAYTKYNLDNCRVLSSQAEEGESLEAVCEGYNGVPLYVNVGDGRYDIDVGVKTGDFRTISPFNDLNATIEWRLKDGKPFAVIARLKDVSMETGGNSALIVETVGSASKPGCRVAHVWNSTGSTQNQRARDIADGTLAAGFSCPSEPQRIG